MSDIVTRLRDWRNVHLARLHLLMEEAADEMARLRADNNRRANLEQGLRDAIVRLSANGDFPVPDNAAKQDNNDRLAALQALAELDEELGLPRRTPIANATPSEGSVRSGCTLTAAEREAIEWRRKGIIVYRPGLLWQRLRRPSCLCLCSGLQSSLCPARPAGANGVTQNSRR